MNLKKSVIFTTLISLNLSIFSMQNNKQININNNNDINNNNNNMTSILHLPDELLLIILTKHINISDKLDEIIKSVVEIQNYSNNNSYDKYMSFLSNVYVETEPKEKIKELNLFWEKTSITIPSLKRSEDNLVLWEIYQNIKNRLNELRKLENWSKPNYKNWGKPNYDIYNIYHNFMIIKKELIKSYKYFSLVNKQFNQIIKKAINYSIKLELLNKLNQEQKEILFFILIKYKELNIFSEIIIADIGKDLALSKLLNKNIGINLAIKNDNLDIVKHLVDHNANENTKDKYGNTALIKAAFKENLDIVKYLVNHNADLNIQNKYGHTALMYAIMNNNLDIIDFLIQKNADIYIKDNDGYTALDWAKINNNLDIFLKILIKNGKTILIWAVKNNNFDIVELIINIGTDINIKNNNGDTALILAARNNNLDITDLLIKTGANINIKNNNGDTALIYAVKNNNLDMVDLLIQNGINVNIRNNNKETALTWAKKINEPHIINILIQNGAK